VVLVSMNTLPCFTQRSLAPDPPAGKWRGPSRLGDRAMYRGGPISPDLPIRQAREKPMKAEPEQPRPMIPVTDLAPWAAAIPITAGAGERLNFQDGEFSAGHGNSSRPASLAGPHSSPHNRCGFGRSRTINRGRLFINTLKIGQ